jgi:hypothetical protein
VVVTLFPNLVRTRVATFVEVVGEDGRGVPEGKALRQQITSRL